MKLAIFISGRGSNMEAIASAVEHGVLRGIATIELVLSNNPEAKGLEVARSMNIPTAVVVSKGKKRQEFDREVMALLADKEIDYIVLAGFMRRLTAEFTGRYAGKIINIHPADTRQHRGLHAYEWAWENRLDMTMITIHYVNEKIDDGQIIAQAPVDLRGAKSLEEVEKRGLAVEHVFYAQTLAKLFSGKLK